MAKIAETQATRLGESLSRWLRTFALAVGLLHCGTALAEEGETPDPSTNRNPASIEGLLDEIDELRAPRVPAPGLDGLLNSWYEFKRALADDHGLRFGVAYTGLYQYATETLTGEDQAAGGIFEVVGTWNAFDRDGAHPGTLGFRVESRHRLWTDVSPQALFTQIGAGVPTGIGFGEFDLALAELWWEQEIVKDRFNIRVGKMLPFGYYDYFLFKNPKTGFTNAAFALNPTIGWANFGLGITTEIRPREDIYIVAGIHDANGSPTKSGFGTLFDDREYFVIAEVGYDPGYLKDGTKNAAAPDYHLTFWHTDARKTAGRPEGWGFSATAQHPFGGVVPFVRYGYSEGGAALLRQIVMAGVVWTSAFDYKQDDIGLAVSWAEPSNSSLDDQLTSEFYYKMQFTRRVAVTSTVQLLVNPSANPATDLIALFGIRVRVDF